MLRAQRAFDLDLVEQIDELFRALDDDHATVDLVEGLLKVHQLLHQQTLFKRAAPSSLKALRWARQLGQRSLMAKALTYRGALALDTYDLSVAFEAFIEALQIGRESGDASRLAVCYLNLSVLMNRLGRDQAALACMEASFEWSTQVSFGYVSVAAYTLVNLSYCHLKQGNWRTAVDVARKAQIALDQANGTQDTAQNRVHYASAIQNEVSALIYLSDFRGAQSATKNSRRLPINILPFT